MREIQERLLLDFGSGALSRYAFQSFVPNPGTKGFPLLSGLVQQFPEDNKA